MRMKIHISRSILPNLFTVSNIFFGFLAIIYAVQEQFVLAVWYILFASVCDALDGFMARLTKSASEFGVELDSLADVVSFGVAPSFIVYKLFLVHFGTIGPLISAMPLIFGALRLARFNVQLVGFHKDHFTGLPIPLAALTILSFILFFIPKQIQTSPQLQYIFLGLIVSVSLLMVSTIRYPVIPKFSIKSIRTHPIQMALIIASVLLLAVTGLRALFPVLFTIVLSGFMLALMRSIKYFFDRLLHKKHEQDMEPEPSLIKHRR